MLPSFLSGNYYGTTLIALKEYLSTEVERLRAIHVTSPDLLFFEGVREIVMLTEGMPDDSSRLMLSMKKITDYARQTAESSLPFLMPLFYNKHFRNLYAYALHLYWQSNDTLFDVESLSCFDGRVESGELLNVLKERLTRSDGGAGLTRLVQYVRLLFNLEKDLRGSRDEEQTADMCRERAFHLLDWIPSLTGRAGRQININICFQIGINFQQASRLETRPELKMADEKIAMKMYLTVVNIGHHSTPDVEMYANTQVLRYLSAFQFQDVMLVEAIPALQKRTMTVADVFPFFEGAQSNVAFLRNKDKMLHLMRRLLHSMIALLDYNKTHTDEIPIDHSAVTVLYQAYEACLKNWYQEEYDAETEKKFRIDLMDELLFENSWTFLDVEQNVDSPWIMVDRDDEGWMKPVRSLPYRVDDSIVKYRAINGAEVNHKTGEITFFMEPWHRDRPQYEQAFTLFDLQEMLARNLGWAIFSLDPVDPDKPYHPFNAMRFAPSQLCETELLNTMLLTDYVLKFLTTNQEVQGQYPYAQRPVDRMISHLPPYLRKIIDDFHSAQHTGAMHRFWIEAEEIDVLLSDEVLRRDDIARVGLGGLKMVVKKHCMARDIHGELRDVGDENEGWPIYVLTEAQMHELERGDRIIDGHAMIFIHGRIRVHFWENSRILLTHIPQDFHESLVRLYKQPREDDCRVAANTRNMPLIYRAIRTMSDQAGLPHCYSPEFIFAHEFTVYYDEFAQYLPEFGRLRELSKISALIRFLNGMRRVNEEQLEALNFLLGRVPSPMAPPDTDSYKRYTNAHRRTIESITKAFQEWRRNLDPRVLWRDKREQLEKMRAQIGQLTFGNYSDEVNAKCDEMFRENRRLNSYEIPDCRIRDAVDARRGEIARRMSEAKQTWCLGQLNEIFSPILTPMIGSAAVDDLINGFMWRNDIDSLADALVNDKRAKAQRQIQEKNFPTCSVSYIVSALNGSDDAVVHVANEESSRQRREQKETKDRIEAGFVRVGLGREVDDVDLEGRCLWVPASVRHDIHEAQFGYSRSSFFVYGGVSVHPDLNVRQGGGGPLGGNPVGGAFNRAEITRGFQQHHIISPTNTQTQSHPLLAKAGFNVESRANKIFLPTQASQHPSRSIHIGRHTSAAMSDVRKAMDRVVIQGESQGWGQSQYRAELRSTLSDLRQELRAGNIALNSIHRPWAQ